MSTPPPTFETYLDEWLAVRSTRLQPYSVKSYTQTISCYVVPHLGQLRLDEIDVRKLDATYAKLLRAGGKGGKPLSPRTVQYAASVIHSALDHATKTGLIGSNPASYATTPKFTADGEDPSLDELPVWTAEEVRQFLNAQDHDLFGAIWTTALGTGMRRGELLGLRWEDVNFAEQTLHIRRALSVVNSNARLKSTKTSQVRSIRIGDRVQQALESRASQQRRDRARTNGGWQDEWGLVFTERDGSYVNPDAVSRRWRDVVRATDLPVIRLHDLRHTHATLMVQAGVPIKVVSQRLGHSKIQMTLDRYTHVLPAMDEKAVERFANLINGEGDGSPLATIEGWQEITFYVSDALRARIDRAVADSGATLGDILREMISEHLS